MKVRFLADFRGVLTNEAFYMAGQEVEFDVETATALITEGRAEAVDQDVSQRGKGT